MVFGDMLNLTQKFLSYFSEFSHIVLRVFNSKVGDLPVINSISKWAIWGLLPEDISSVMTNFLTGANAPTISELLFTTFIPTFIALTVIKWFTSLVFK